MGGAMQSKEGQVRGPLMEAACSDCKSSDTKWRDARCHSALEPWSLPLWQFRKKDATNFHKGTPLSPAYVSIKSLECM